MKRGPQIFLPLPKTGIAFRPEFLDFKRGIRVGNLEESERITKILKLSLEARYQQSFVTERWGRGVYWQWIGFLPKANRLSKPISSHVSFGCAKYFITVDQEKQLFECGMQVERGYIEAPPEAPECQLREDWDWNRLLDALQPGGPLEHELKRLVLKEGFLVHGGAWEQQASYSSRKNLPGVTKIRRQLEAAPGDRWAGFQIFYPMRENEVRASTGLDLVESMLAAFDEVTPAMNLTMQIELQPAG